ncbi:MAG: cobalamin-dependent protein, partial [Thermodesulfobacteriota bacterium]
CVDSFALDHALQLAFSCLSPSDVIKKIMIPVLNGLGNGWSQGKVGIAAEHLASNTFVQKIKNLIGASQASSGLQPGSPKALCACFPGEDHTLGLVNVAYILASQGFQIVFLGSNLPFSDLGHAISQTKPTSVWLSVTDPALYQRYLLDLILLAKKYQPLPFVLGGQALTYDNPALQNAGCMQCLQPCELPEDLMALPFV